MKVYDLEVLNIKIGDSKIEYYLKEYQKEVVYNNLEMKKLEKNLIFTKKSENIKRERLDEESKTDEKENELQIKRIGEENSQETLRREGDIENRKLLDELDTMILKIKTLKDAQQLDVSEKDSKIKTAEYEKQMAAIQPRMIEAMISLAGVQTTQILAKNLKGQGGGLSSIFNKGGFNSFLGAIKGTPMHDNLMKVFEEYKNLETNK